MPIRTERGPIFFGHEREFEKVAKHRCCIGGFYLRNDGATALSPPVSATRAAMWYEHVMCQCSIEISSSL